MERVSDAMAWLREEATRDPFVAGRLAEILLLGNNAVPKDEANAFRYAQLAEAGRDPGGTVVLAAVYIDGSVVPQDVEVGIDYWEKAAKLGSLQAQLSIAQIHRVGSAKRRVDKSKAYFWALIAAGNQQGVWVGLRDSAHLNDAVRLEAAQLRDELAKELPENEPQKIQAQARGWKPEAQRIPSN